MSNFDTVQNRGFLPAGLSRSLRVCFLLAVLSMSQACLSPDSDSSDHSPISPEDFVVKGNGDAFDGKLSQTVQVCRDGESQSQTGSPFEADGFFKFLNDCEPATDGRNEKKNNKKNKEASVKKPRPTSAPITRVNPTATEQVPGQALTDSPGESIAMATGPRGGLAGRPIGYWLEEKWSKSPFMAPNAPRSGPDPKSADWISKTGFDAKDICVEDFERLSPAEFNAKCNDWKIGRAIAICRAPSSKDKDNPFFVECRDFLKDVALYQDLSDEEKSESKLQELVGVEPDRDDAETDFGF